MRTWPDTFKTEFEKKKTEFKTDVNKSILDKYGGAEHLDAPPRELIFAQTEEYVEYSRHGKVIKGEEASVVRSSYEEDVMVSNHTSVWGSWWRAGQWGYKCCHQLLKNSYCTGQAGREVSDSTLTLPPKKDEEVVEEKREKQKKSKKKTKKSKKSKKHGRG